MVVEHGLDESNETGERLVELHDMVVTNTGFKFYPRRPYTWTSPLHKKDRVIPNQIYHMLVNKRYLLKR